jgi:dipeptidyl aminopeptidase/acylaminoacyl peptidase
MTDTMLTERAPALPRLIPREILFGNPEKERARISPDGANLAYLAPHNDMMSVWVRTLGADDDRVVAHDAQRPILWMTWRRDSRHILFVQDRGGDENHRLFQVDLLGGEPRALTPSENVRCTPLAFDNRFPNEGLVLLNARDPRLFDVHRVDLERGECALDTENPGDVIPSGWLADNSLVVRVAVAQRADGTSCLRVRDDAQAPWRELDEFPFADGLPQPLAFSPDNRALYVKTAKDANTSRILRYDVVNCASEPFFEDPRYDVNAIYVDPATREVVAAAVVRERLEWHVLDPRFGPTFAGLHAVRAGEFTIDGGSADGNTIVVHYRSDTEPDYSYSYDRATGRATLLFCSRRALLDQVLAPMTPIKFEARDGLPIHGYLTLPVGVEPRNLPTVLYVHGGPWWRDRWGYEEIVQWLANRGYAVLQVNFRGSIGFGKAFVNAGDRQWAGTMRTDLLDARDWAIAQGYADPGRFAIFGGSYGGYAVLTALTFTPDAFTCGVDLCGPSNLRTFIEAIPPYWETMRKTLAERIGEDQAFLDSQSPLPRAAAIRSPLFMAQGANDPRCKQQESDQIVETLRNKGIPVTYVVFENEGHGFADPANNKRFIASAEKFLADALGGRCEPPRADEQIEPYLR